MAPTTAPAAAATKPAEPTKPAAAATTAPAAAATTAPGAAAGAVKIGVSFALSGPAAVYGAVQKNGVQLAEEELAKGGIAGMKLQLVIDDDAGTPEQGINVFKKLINQDKVAAIIGPTLSNVAQSADPEAQRAGVPVLGVSNTAPKGITDIGDFIFRNSLTEAQVIPQTVKAAKTKLNLKKVAILYSDNDAFTKAGYDVFKAAADAEGLQITTTQTFATKDTDFNAQLTAAKQTSPDALFVSALAAEASGLITQARALGITVPIVGGNGLNTPAIIKNAGKDAEGVIVGAAWNQASSNPKSVDFIKAYKAKFNADPDQFAAQAYTGVYIYAEALKIAKSGERADIRRALTTIKDFDTVLGKFSFTKDRDADHPAVIQIVKDGQFAVFA
ncbi:MAG: ABC transporter substrate-binding protein [Chloroflexi bacterium]|nr:ABC transporter substrate-binding protein [Chloroflexota bacterium]